MSDERVTTALQAVHRQLTTLERRVKTVTMRAKSLTTTDADFFKTVRGVDEEAQKHLNAPTARLSFSVSTVETAVLSGASGAEPRTSEQFHLCSSVCRVCVAEEKSVVADVKLVRNGHAAHLRTP